MIKQWYQSGYSKVRSLIAVLLLVTVFVSALAMPGRPTFGAVPQLEQIRVALFMNLPGKYTTTVPTATLSANDVMNIGVRLPAGPVAWTRVETGQPARFALHGYRALVGESTDFNTAVLILKHVQGKTAAVWMTAVNRGSQTVYQVLEGEYITEAEASASATRWTADSELARLGSAIRPGRVGPLRLETGNYTSLAEARRAASEFGADGIDAFPALKLEGATGVRYVLHLGQAATAAELASLRALVESKSGEREVREADPAVPYLEVRQDFTREGKINAPDPLYLLPLQDTKVWVSTGDHARLTLAERFGRAYRGQFELSGLNGRLAVVNELPFEHYLYSVVGGEMPASWQLEALKAQAVAARTYALYQGYGFQIAHVVDSVLSQVYRGVAAEQPTTIEAVDATRGQVLLHNGRLIEALYSSNAGGRTADASEIWGNAVPYLKSVSSPDSVAEASVMSWYRIALGNGRVGYTREDLLRPSGTKTAAGHEILLVDGDNVLVRPIPLIESDVPPVAQLDRNTSVVLLERVKQSNPMSWVRGPLTPEALAASLSSRLQTPLSGVIRTLEVTSRGPSGRVLELAANGQRLDVRYPDLYRSALGGLPSTLFSVEESGRIALLGAADRRAERTDGAAELHVLGGDGHSRKLAQDHLFIAGGSGTLRAATKSASFRFSGTGFGHGVGLSQWGAKGLAEQGYDYKKILEYYYANTELVQP